MNNVRSLVITKDDKYIISGSNDSTVRVWNFLKKTEETAFIGHNSSVNCVAVTNDNKFVVSGSDDESVRIWDFEEKREFAVLNGHTCYVYSVVIISRILYLR